MVHSLCLPADLDVLITIPVIQIIIVNTGKKACLTASKECPVARQNTINKYRTLNNRRRKLQTPALEGNHPEIRRR